jgi:hypothetical protein
MNRWIDYPLDERMTMIQHVADAEKIDEPAAEKDWWVTAVLYACFILRWQVIFSSRVALA